MPKKKKRAEFIDDGRTVVNMNVEGMPWYHERKPNSPSRGESPESDGNPEVPGVPGFSFPEKLTGKERRAFIWGTTKAVLLIIALFVVVLLAVILFMLR